MADAKIITYFDHQAGFSRISMLEKHNLSLQSQALSRADKALVWVASENIGFTEITINTRKAAVLYKTIPFALEEKIANEPQDNHYAFHKTTQTESLPIAIVEHSLMQHWQTALDVHGIRAEFTLPDIFAVPEYLTEIKEESYDQEKHSKAMSADTLSERSAEGKEITEATGQAERRGCR